MTSTNAAPAEGTIAVGQRNGLSLAILPRSGRSLGTVIVDPDSSDLVAGVAVEPLRIFADDRGYFTELARLGKGLAERFATQAQVQVSFTLTYPGAIKAIHYHFEQTDVWAPLEGMLQVFLYDLRQDSPTFGRINTLYVGRYRPWSLRIPPGIGHGYKVLGADQAMLVYLTDRHYNPEDEGRLAWDHPAIGYDWETQYK
jgi:dTDP-4-dehydrorhamnose 3,5-epimerase